PSFPRAAGQRFASPRVTKIRANAETCHIISTKPVDGSRDAFRVPTVNDDPRARGGKSLGNGPTNAAGGAGHKRLLSRQGQANRWNRSQILRQAFDRHTENWVLQTRGQLCERFKHE